MEMGERMKLKIIKNATVLVDETGEVHVAIFDGQFKPSEWALPDMGDAEQLTIEAAIERGDSEVEV